MCRSDVDQPLASYKVKEKSLLPKPAMLQKGASRREHTSDGGAHGVHRNRAGTPSLHLYPSRHQIPNTLPPNQSGQDQCERSFFFKTQTAVSLSQLILNIWVREGKYTLICWLVIAHVGSEILIHTKHVKLSLRAV